LNVNYVIKYEKSVGLSNINSKSVGLSNINSKSVGLSNINSKHNFCVSLQCEFETVIFLERKIKVWVTYIIYIERRSLYIIYPT